MLLPCYYSCCPSLIGVAHGVSHDMALGTTTWFPPFFWLWCFPLVWLILLHTLMCMLGGWRLEYFGYCNLHQQPFQFNTLYVFNFSQDFFPFLFVFLLMLFACSFFCMFFFWFLYVWFHLFFVCFVQCLMLCLFVWIYLCKINLQIPNSCLEVRNERVFF